MQAKLKEVKQELQRRIHRPIPEQGAYVRIEWKPIFSIRMICCGYLCASIVNRLASQIGFDRIDFDSRALLTMSRDEFLNSDTDEIVTAVEAVDCAEL
jgi:hypothetical protein